MLCLADLWRQLGEEANSLEDSQPSRNFVDREANTSKARPNRSPSSNIDAVTCL
jgi:hypothetical protein